MKNILTLIIVVACVGLIYFGLTQKNQEPKPIPVVNNQTSPEAPTPTQNTTDNQALTQPDAQPVIVIGSTTPIKQTMKKYYPDSQPAVSGAKSTGSIAVSAEQDFQITSSLMAKMHLVDKYKPGICFGTPVTPPQSAISSMKSSNEPLWQFIKGHYGLSSELEIYNKIKQLQGAWLTETASGIFNFRFMDGQCQSVTYYEGIVKVVGSTVTETITSQADHTY